MSTLPNNMIEMNEIIWTTRGHKKIPITQLEDRHLFNIIRVIRKRIAYYNEVIDAGFSLMGFIQGEMAGYAIESEIDNVQEKLMDQLWWLDVMLAEVDRRKEVTGLQLLKEEINK